MPWSFLGCILIPNKDVKIKVAQSKYKPATIAQQEVHPLVVGEVMNSFLCSN